MKTTKLIFSFSKLRNSEYPLVVGRILEIVSKHNLEELALKKAYDRVALLQPELEKIKIQEKTSGLTSEIAAANKLRDKITIVIFNLVNNFKQLGISPYSDNAKTLHLWLSKYGKSIVKENNTSQTEKTNQLIAEMEVDEAIKKALSALHLTDLFVRLKKANEEFERLFRSRTSEVASLPEVDAKAIRQQADKELNKLFVAIDFCASEYEDKDYKPLISELQELLNYHKTQIKARKNKKVLPEVM
ncbi:DUF6261 family protein [Capnocytophaga cynodegmi]|uniref:DUF6261 family protein n=1 Tax=Capnocytophaga cynodegmi TaxID=28189 RepID=UPI00385E7EC1